MSANTYGRQVVLPLTNKSGGGVIAGDVVVLDSTNNDAFTTSTAGAVTIPIGIAQETIANNAVGRVLIEGYAALVNVNASVTRGDYGKTHTVAKQATDAGASRVAGTFCWFLTGGTTPDAWVYPVDLAGAALTDPTTTRGDIITRGASAIQRLALGTAGQSLISNGTDAVYGYPYGTLLAIVNLANATNYTTTSSTQADVDATNVKIVFTAPASGNVLVRVTCAVNISAAVQNASLGLRESTTNLVNSPNGQFAIQGNATAATEHQVAWVAYLTGVSAGSHTYKLAFSVNGGATFIVRNFVGAPIIMEVWSVP